jgi:predicted RNA-binding protein Jag
VIQIAMAEAGAIEALVDAMHEFEDDAAVLEGCLLALSNLCMLENNVQRAIDAQLIELTVNAMNKSVDVSGLQEHGCAVLANLAVHPMARGRIRDCGGCDAILVSMVVNPLDVGVQSQALVGLKNLCVKDDESKVFLEKSGAIDVIVQVMRDHKENPIIQASGSWALSIIGVNEDNRAYMGANSGMDVIVGSMRDHADNLDVQEKAFRALWTLSVNPRIKSTMLDAGAIRVIVSTMHNHISEPIIQERGCGVLGNMAANDSNVKIQAVNDGALEVVVMAMVLHGENDKVQERAVALLHKLCIPENIKSMIDANVSPMMVIATSIPNCEQKASYVLTQLEPT